jgi:hypothetical protein
MAYETRGEPEKIDKELLRCIIMAIEEATKN